ncbi:MAG: hypothetical protein GY851_26195 [bacterium]|nr:hypothetical protein [bacterium]
MQNRTILTAFLVVLWTAAPVFAQAQPEPGESPAAYNTAGVEAYKAKQWEEAIANFERAYELALDNETIRSNLCNAYHAYAITLANGGDVVGAIGRLELAISVKPDNPLPLIQLGACYLKAKMTSDAIFKLEDAIQLAPENVDAHDLLGDAYYEDHDVPAALAEWEYVQEVAPDRPGVAQKLEKAYREDAEEHDYRKTQSRNFQISFERGTSGGDLRKVLTACERAYRDIGRKFGGVYPPTPIQVILNTAEDFEKVTLLGEHVGAVYDGKIRVPITDRSGRSISDEELTRRLYHEYTHVVVRYWVDDNVPWWLNEGLAETFSRDGLSPRDSETLQLAKEEGLLFGLGDLQEGQLMKLDPTLLHLAYIQSHATVRFMWDKFGLRSLTLMLNAMAEDENPERALLRAYRLKYDQLQKEVAARIGKVKR